LVDVTNRDWCQSGATSAARNANSAAQASAKNLVQLHLVLILIVRAAVRGTKQAADVLKSISKVIMSHTTTAAICHLLPQLRGATGTWSNMLDNHEAQTNSPALLGEQVQFCLPVSFLELLLNLKPQQMYQDASMTEHEVIPRIAGILKSGEETIVQLVRDSVMPVSNVVAAFGDVEQFWHTHVATVQDHCNTRDLATQPQNAMTTVEACPSWAQSSEMPHSCRF
jgi:hypothetical protein